MLKFNDSRVTGIALNDDRAVRAMFNGETVWEINRTYLYNAGDDNTPLTGGWTLSGNYTKSVLTATDGNKVMWLYNYGSSYSAAVSATSKNKIALTGYSTLVIECAVGAYKGASGSTLFRSRYSAGAYTGSAYVSGASTQNSNIGEYTSTGMHYSVGGMSGAIREGVNSLAFGRLRVPLSTNATQYIRMDFSTNIAESGKQPRVFVAINKIWLE